MARDSHSGNPQHRKQEIEEKIKQGKCTYYTCDKNIDREGLCKNHYLELVVNLNGQDVRGLATFCRNGRLDMMPIMRKHGVLSKRPPPKS